MRWAEVPTEPTTRPTVRAGHATGVGGVALARLDHLDALLSVTPEGDVLRGGHWSVSLPLSGEPSVIVWEPWLRSAAASAADIA